MTHGYDFKDMYRQDEYIKMKHKALTGFYHDKSSNIIGYQLYDIVTKHLTDYQFAPFEDYSDYTLMPIEAELIEAHETTRLVGFRSGKKCHESRVI